MILVVLTDDDPSAAVKRFLTRTGFMLIPLSVLLVKYYPDLGRGYNRWTWTPYYTGVATGKNGLGYVCMLFGLASLWRILETFREDESEGRVRSLIVHGIVLAMALWLFRLADSVTSFACFLIGTVLIVATSPGRIRRRAASVHLVMAMLVLFLIFGYFISGGTGLVQAMGRDPTLTGRTALWDDILRMRVDPLFGAGFESFWLGTRIDKLWAVYWWHPSQAHNGYLEVFLNLGWTGVCLLAGVIVTGYRNVVRRFAGDPGTARLALAYFVIALLYNLTEAAFKLIHPVWVVFLLAVCAMPALAEDR
jgi:O-antigen ligase